MWKLNEYVYYSAMFLNKSLQLVDGPADEKKKHYRTHPRKRPGARIMKFLKSGEGALTRVGGA